MNTNLIKQKLQLLKSFKKKQYREAFVESNISEALAFQIRNLRQNKKWTQAQLARKSKFKQEAISRLENPDYGSYTLNTLKKLSTVFDVALLVRFVPYSELLDRVTNKLENDANVKSFDEDILLSSDVPTFQIETKFERFGIDENDPLNQNVLTSSHGHAAHKPLTTNPYN